MKILTASDSIPESFVIQLSSGLPKRTTSCNFLGIIKTYPLLSKQSTVISFGVIKTRVVSIATRATSRLLAT